MKVLNINVSLDPVTGGGTAERTFQMSRFIAKAGISCSILTTDIGLTLEHREKLKGIELLACPCLWERFYLPRCSYGQIKRLIESADIVHLMGHWSFLNALAYLLIRRAGKPYVVCPAGALPIYGRSRNLKRFYNWVIGRKIIQNANCCIAITESEIPQMEKYGVTSDKIVVIPNGINLDEVTSQDTCGFRKRYGLEDTKFLLFVGRLSPIKGPDLLLRAFCKLKDAFPAYGLVFAGPDGGMLSELKKIASECDLGERAHFVGYLGGEEKFQAYREADLLVIPSRQEAMSIVVLEAGSVGTPVLLTDRCGFSDISDIGGGLVVSACAEGLEKGLAELLSDRAKLQSMGSELMRYTREKFSWDVIVNSYRRLYDQLLASPLAF